MSHETPGPSDSNRFVIPQVTGDVVRPRSPKEVKLLEAQHTQELAALWVTHTQSQTEGVISTALQAYEDGDYEMSGPLFDRVPTARWTHTDTVPMHIYADKYEPRTTAYAGTVKFAPVGNTARLYTVDVAFTNLVTSYGSDGKKGNLGVKFVKNSPRLLTYTVEPWTLDMPGVVDTHEAFEEFIREFGYGRSGCASLRSVSLDMRSKPTLSLVAEDTANKAWDKKDTFTPTFVFDAKEGKFLRVPLSDKERQRYRERGQSLRETMEMEEVAKIGGSMMDLIHITQIPY